MVGENLGFGEAYLSFSSFVPNAQVIASLPTFSSIRSITFLLLQGADSNSNLELRLQHILTTFPYNYPPSLNGVYVSRMSRSSRLFLFVPNAFFSAAVCSDVIFLYRLPLRCGYTVLLQPFTYPRVSKYANTFLDKVPSGKSTRLVTLEHSVCLRKVCLPVQS